MSQTQAKSALALKSIVNLSEAELKQIFPSSKTMKVADKTTNIRGEMTHKDRLRAAVRGALGSKHPHEADISDSQFLGRATSGPTERKTSPTAKTAKTESKIEDESTNDSKGTLLSDGQESVQNPVDDM